MRHPIFAASKANSQSARTNELKRLLRHSWTAKFLSSSRQKFTACLLTSGLLSSGLAGCATVPEQAAIESFLQAVKAQDGNTLAGASTPEFRQTALRHRDSPRDLKMLRIPEGEIEISKIEDISDDEKRVVVEVGEDKRKVMYGLQRDPNTKKWLVDDVFLRQRRDGITITKSVTEQMDLLLTVREFADTWQKGERDDLITSVDAELSAQLSSLPPMVLAQIAKQVSDTDSAATFRPEAEIRDDWSIVRIPRRTGDLVLTLKNNEGHWEVQDLAIESREDGSHIKSLKTYAKLMQAGIEFLDAYNQGSKTRLAAISEPSFYEGSLLPGKLSSVPLPNRGDLANGFELKHSGERADLMITSKTDTVRLTLETISGEEKESQWGAYVSDVTIYQADRSQTMRLSSALTAIPVMEVFSQALRERKLEMLQMTSTMQLNEAIWNRMSPEVMSVIPMMRLRPIEPEVISTSFHGDLTEINTIQGDQSVTYVLRLVDGSLFVDDVQLPESITGELSLKSTLTYTLPIYEFAMRWHRGDIKGQTPFVSQDFSRRVLSQFQEQPILDFDLVSWLTMKMDRIDEKSDKQHVLIFRDDHRQTEVAMLRQGEQWVIDDVVLSGQQFAQQPFRLKQSMKLQVIRQFEDASIRPVSGLTQSPSLPNVNVVPAMHFEQKPSVNHHNNESQIQTMGYQQQPSPYFSEQPSPTQEPAKMTPDNTPLLLQEIPIQ